MVRAWKGRWWDRASDLPAFASRNRSLHTSHIASPHPPDPHPDPLPHPPLRHSFVPVEVGLLLHAWGWHGLLLCYLSFGITSVWYFSLALMNHNAEHCSDIDLRNSARDWGEAQLYSSADFACESSFLGSIPWLWLNYHTVHHLFPHTDMSKHPGIQQILIKTCKEFNVNYRVSDPVTLYREMVGSFQGRSPLAVFKEINPYSGAI